MTEKEIDAMEAGREMDAAVHMALYPRHNIETFENIDLLLWHHCDGEHEKGDSCRWKEIPRYSTDIGAAWQVVEKFQQQDTLHMFADACPICDSTPWSWCGYSAAEMALIICQSALKAVLTLDCAACQKPVPLYALIKEYEWYFCRDCQHTIAMTDIQVRGRDRRGIFERAVADCHKIATTGADEPTEKTG